YTSFVSLSFFFFFSSRRRHTRSKRDWSSDVCSSDLPSQPRERQPAWGQKCREVSTVRGRRLVGDIGSGRTGRGAWGCAVSCSHRAQWGLCVRPANALGSLER